MLHNGTEEVTLLQFSLVHFFTKTLLYVVFPSYFVLTEVISSRVFIAFASVIVACLNSEDSKDVLIRVKNHFSISQMDSYNNTNTPHYRALYQSG